MTTKWSSYRGVPLKGHLHVAEQQTKKVCTLSSVGLDLIFYLYSDIQTHKVFIKRRLLSHVQ